MRRATEKEYHSRRYSFIFRVPRAILVWRGLVGHLPPPLPLPIEKGLPRKDPTRLQAPGTDLHVARSFHCRGLSVLRDFDSSEELIDSAVLIHSGASG